MMDLKTFAVAVYSEPGVAPACLTLQDNNQVDVPLLLFCGWYGALYGQLALPDLRRAVEISHQLGAHLIKPLRQTRRWMKTHSVDAATDARWNTLREDIKRAELAAELLMLDTLQAQFHRPPSATEQTETERVQPDIQKQAIRHNLRLLVSDTHAAEAPVRDNDDIAATRDNCLEQVGHACFITAQQP